MKELLNKIGLAVFAAAALTVALLPDDAGASGAPQNLNITNQIIVGQTLTGFPTNSVGTNGVYLSTGTPVATFNQEHFGFNFQGLSTAIGSTNTIGFLLCSAMTANTPRVLTTQSNAWVGTYTQTDWTTNAIGNTPLWVIVNLPAGTNWVNYQTNFHISTFGPDCGYIGIFQITNNLVLSEFVTNAQASIYTKLIPSPLIGQ